jgi:hypothetical protein
MIEQRLERFTTIEKSPSLDYEEPVSLYPLLNRTQEGKPRILGFWVSLELSVDY